MVVLAVVVVIGSVAAVVVGSVEAVVVLAVVTGSVVVVASVVVTSVVVMAVLVVSLVEGAPLGALACWRRCRLARSEARKQGQAGGDTPALLRGWAVGI